MALPAENPGSIYLAVLRKSTEFARQVDLYCSIHEKGNSKCFTLHQRNGRQKITKPKHKGIA